MRIEFETQSGLRACGSAWTSRRSRPARTGCQSHARTGVGASPSRLGCGVITIGHRHGAEPGIGRERADSSRGDGVTSRVDTSPLMDARSAVKILTRVESWGAAPWVKGGWGIDALLGMQTRPHADLDLVVARPECAVIQAALEPLGFVHDTWVEPGLPARFVLRTDSGHQVDLHPVIVDELGNGWQPLGAGAWTEYPAEALGALGSIEGRQVRCLTPELQLRHHLGYPVDDKDLHDLRILATEYRLAIPPGLLDRDAQRAEVV